MALSKLTVLNDKYVLRKVLGSHGPYDVSYLAWNLAKERTAVVIREYNPSFIVKRTEDGTHFKYKNTEARNYFEYGLNCFVREAAATALIDHPNVVRHEDYFRENQTSYCVSTYYPGATLSKVLDGNESKIEKRAAYAIIMPLLDGLLAGHRQGLIHGRLSPDQIFLTKSGRPMLFRFHVTRILLARRCGRVLDLNERGYTAPELLVPNGKKGPWSDIYSCGATLYSIITGKTPVDALNRTENDPFLDILHAEEDISAGLKKLLYRAMSVNPDERPQSILEFKQELMNVMDIPERDYREEVREPRKKSAFSLENAPALGELSLQKDPPARVSSLFNERPPFSAGDDTPVFPPRQKAFSNGGDGFSTPAELPLIDSEESSRTFVETNPLGPFAHEKMPVKSEKTENALTPSQIAFSRLEAHRERIQLKKVSVNKLLPVLVSVGAVLVISILWLSGAFSRPDTAGVIEPPPADPGSELVASAAASSQPEVSEPIGESISAVVAVPDSMNSAPLTNAPVPEVSNVSAVIDSFALGSLNIERGDSLRALQQYQQAALYYQSALTYLPGDVYADSMVNIVEGEFRELTNANLVRQYVRTAQGLIDEQKFIEAREALEQALRIRPGDSWVVQQLADLNELANNQGEEARRFQYLVAQGDGFFEAGDYQKALDRYEEASLINGEDAYVLEQVSQSKDSVQILISRQEARDNLYDVHIAKADSFLAGFDFDNALAQYQSALKQRPEDTYALDQVMTVQKKRLEQIDRLTDEQGVFEVTDVLPKLVDEADLTRQIQYPLAAERSNVEGRVVLKMIVHEDGSVSDIEVIRGIGMGCDKEAVRVMKKARFEPAVHQGQNVKAWYTYSIVFRLAR